MVSHLRRGADKPYLALIFAAQTRRHRNQPSLDCQGSLDTDKDANANDIQYSTNYALMCRGTENMEMDVSEKLMYACMRRVE